MDKELPDLESFLGQTGSRIVLTPSWNKTKQATVETLGQGTLELQDQGRWRIAFGLGDDAESATENLKANIKGHLLRLTGTTEMHRHFQL